MVPFCVVAIVVKGATVVTVVVANRTVGHEASRRPGDCVDHATLAVCR
jgi:hypothetical protein